VYHSRQYIADGVAVLVDRIGYVFLMESFRYVAQDAVDVDQIHMTL
jgi:hypothetical protein